MPLEVSHLRRWFALGALSLALTVTGAYFYARHRVENALKEVPEKIGTNIQQSAQGFSISRSQQGHTLFQIHASKAVQFKQGGRAELHDVTITLYGRDSSRFDQIYGADFVYDPQSGDVIGKGEVQIDLQANAEGLTAPDQAPPKELKNPIHLRTTDLRFNQKTGNASTKEKVDFSIPQASGSATGVNYVSNTSVLTLESNVNVAFTGPTMATLTANHGVITKVPHVVLLDRPKLHSGSRSSEADHAKLFLSPDNSVERILADGNVKVWSEGPQPIHVQSRELELIAGERRDTVATAIFSGEVQLSTSGSQLAEGNAERATLSFSATNLLRTVSTEGGVKLLQHQRSASGSKQDLEIRAPAIGFQLASNGRHLARAETSGPPEIAIRPVAPAGEQTLITAGKFTAKFDDLGQLASAHGEPNARIVTHGGRQPDRVSTSSTVDAFFRPGAGVESVVQQGNIAYVDGKRKAWGDHARYTPADRMLLLTGSPRVIDGSMTTTAVEVRLNRASGDVFAEGDVKSTYSDLQSQPGGALLASSSPIHLTAKKMTAHRASSTATYTGDARLWQDANLVEAPSIEFDRERRTMVARGSDNQLVSTVLVQSGADGKATPVTVTSPQLTYTDGERKASFEGGAVAKGADATITANQIDVFLQPRERASSGRVPDTTSRVDYIVARDQVVITQPGRRAVGNQLVYTSSDDKFMLTGGSPSIFDAEHGKITGVSLTFFRHDDRVLVEGNTTTPTVTKTRVAR
jgi:lipopolysaccharide export system protein LptA